MCVHWRIIYRKCNHWSWGDIATKCQVERRFDSGQSEVGCDTMVSQSMKSLKVDKLCAKCTERKASTDSQFAKVKSVLAELRQAVDSMVMVAETDLDVPGEKEATKSFGDNDDLEYDEDLDVPVDFRSSGSFSGEDSSSSSFRLSSSSSSSSVSSGMRTSSIPPGSSLDTIDEEEVSCLDLPYIHPSYVF